MKITQDVREFAKEQNIEEEKTLAVGMAEKPKRFLAISAEIYHRNIPEVVKQDH